MGYFKFLRGRAFPPGVGPHPLGAEGVLQVSPAGSRHFAESPAPPASAQGRPRLPGGPDLPLRKWKTCCGSPIPPNRWGIATGRCWSFFTRRVLRVSELVHLSVNDVNLEVGYVRTKGKGARERIVPIGEAARQALKGYLDGPRRNWARQSSNRHLVPRKRRPGRSPAKDSGKSSGSMPRPPGLASASRPIRCAILLRPIFWKGGPICGRCNRCSGMWTLPPPKCTLMFPGNT